METLEELYEFYLEHGIQWSQGETPLGFKKWKEIHGFAYSQAWKVTKSMLSAPIEEE